jgi:cyclopropane-fatty-acyl-phospholipid synthase
MVQEIADVQQDPIKNTLPSDIVSVDKEAIEKLIGIPKWMRSVFKLLTHLRWGQLVVILPDKRAFRFAGREPGTEGVLQVHDYKFATRILRGGSLGFAEGYLAGEWESPKLSRMLEVFANNIDDLEEHISDSRLVRLARTTFHFLHLNTKRGAKKNIHAHYDLGNEFYEQWLDPTMTYSCARFESPNQSLSDAQKNKYRTLASNLNLTPQSSLLEIGSGWGGFAEFAASEIGCKVVGITISQEQLDFARKRIEQQGLTDRVEFRFQDYRDVAEKFDAIASIEMFEAVGESYWPIYFAKIRDSLTEGGRAGLQIITIKEEHFPSYRLQPDFIRRYIFPGGLLPPPSALVEQAKQAGLRWVDNVNFGQDYAQTLAHWRQSFLSAWPQIRSLGFDERFKRLWRYYLACCEAGFRARSIDVTQITLAK